METRITANVEQWAHFMFIHAAHNSTDQETRTYCFCVDCETFRAMKVTDDHYDAMPEMQRVSRLSEDDRERLERETLEGYLRDVQRAKQMAAKAQALFNEMTSNGQTPNPLEVLSKLQNETDCDDPNCAVHGAESRRKVAEMLLTGERNSQTGMYL